jgi:hypothetical protein
MSLKVLGPKPYFWQWDVGQKLVVDNPDCGEVHFDNGTTDLAPVVRIKTDKDGNRVAEVPNNLLQTAKPLKCYLFQETESGAMTSTLYTFQVLPRPRPADYVYTETEVLSYSYLDKRLDNLEGEGLSKAVSDYLKENPVQAGATAEEAAQITQNKEDIGSLKKDKLDASELPTAINDALAQAKASGEFKGDPGQPGKDGAPGADGKDYVLTENDKAEIAELAAELVDVPDSGGNVDLTGVVRSVNGQTPDENGNVQISVSGGGVIYKGTTDINIRKWFGRKIVIDGSSITCGGDKVWGDFLKDMFALDAVYNHAASGTGWFIGPTTLLQRVDDYEADADAVIIMGDYNGIFTFSGGGTPDDDAAEDGSCYGKLKFLAEKLINKYPLCPIIWVIEPPRAAVGELDSGCIPMNYNSEYNKYSKIIEEVAELYGFTHCNMMKNTVFRPWIQANFDATTSDGTHPWANVQRTMAQVIAETMKRTPIFYNESYVITPESGGNDGGDDNGDDSGDSDIALTKIIASVRSGCEMYEHDSLDALRQYIVVRAVYSDLSEEVIDDYTLSGELAVGTSTVTIAYKGQETSVSFEVISGYRVVTVTQASIAANGKQGVYMDRETAVGTVYDDIKYNSYDDAAVSNPIRVVPGTTITYSEVPLPNLTLADIVFLDAAYTIVHIENCVYSVKTYTVPDDAVYFVAMLDYKTDRTTITYSPG